MKISFSVKTAGAAADTYVGAVSKEKPVKGAASEYMKKSFSTLKSGMKALYVGAGEQKELSPEKTRRLAGFGVRE